MGTRRQIARTAAKALNPDATVLDLPQGAPFGAESVDHDIGQTVATVGDRYLHQLGVRQKAGNA